MFGEYSILPPHWRETRDSSGQTVYVNEISGEQSSVHPYEKFLEASKNINKIKSRPSTSNTQSSENFWKDVISKPTKSEEDFLSSFNQENNENSQELLRIEYPMNSYTEEKASPLPNPLLDETSRPTTRGGGKTKSKGAKYDYHCQWSERDIFGKVTLYGLTIRFLDNGDTLLKFDGINGEWTFTALKGPYGVLEMQDLFIGARVNVFGRHLTISSANAAACNWIQSEQARLEKEQEEFRRKIESLGEVPCIRKKTISTIRDITRNAKTAGQTNLRQILKDNARLGDQLASLGLADQIVR
jgi:hypothetical protein